MTPSDRYLTYMGAGPRKVAHWEHWSCPDAETYLTGIDYYDHPRRCRIRLAELYPELGLGVPETDDPRPRPELDLGAHSSSGDADGRHHVRWGDGETWHWDWGHACKSLDEVFAYSPLKSADYSAIPVVESRDYRDEEAIYRLYRSYYPAEWGDEAPEGSDAGTGFYNTMFMWPLLVFGWELFMEACLDPRFDRVMEEFAEINRRVFRTFARLPIRFIVCHDDIVNTRGPVCSRAWMHRHIFPRYEEFWSIARAAGKRIIFMSDGRMDAYADDVMACGATGIVTEPYTDFKAIARRHPNCVLAGEGDNRVLTRNDPDEIRAMVASMAETARMSGGYFMCVGNHIPWNVTPQGIERYLACSRELAIR
jgi:hypothetical protein